MSEWWRNLYSERFYFDIYQAEDLELAKTEVDDLVRALDLNPPTTILDCPCGYGRHSIELALRGFDVTGVDLSELQIEEARRIACERGAGARSIDADAQSAVAVAQFPAAGARFVVADARALPFPDGSFDLVLNLFLSFGYFEQESENEAMMRELVRVLKPGGRIVIDQWNRENEIRHFGIELIETNRNGVQIETVHRFDPLTGRIWWKCSANFPDGSAREWDHSVRAYTVFELKTMLERCGVRVTALYGAFDARPWTLDEQQTVIVGEKAR
jgi:SAM-dependent methyltransferase